MRGSIIGGKGMIARRAASARKMGGVTFALVMLAGCGEAGGDAVPEPDATATATVMEPPGNAADSAVSYRSAEALAKAIDCRDIERSKEKDEVVAAESQAGCILGGETAYLVMFADNMDRDRFVKLSDVMVRPRLIGNGWVIHASPEALKELQGEVGGELRSVS